MSSFNNRVARAKKEKGGQLNTQPGKERGKREGATGAGSTAVVEEQVDPVGQIESATSTEEVSEHTEELYGEDQGDQSKPTKWQREIPLDRIRPNPFQPRKTFDPVKLNELAEGMKEHGWIGGGLPVRAATDEPNAYELVWGERRWRAAKIAGLKAIPCVISEYSDEDVIEKGLLENIQREDLSNLEEGQAYVNLLALRTEQGKPRYSIRRLATRISKDKSYIEERLKYARVPVDIQQLAVDQPDISPRTIHELGELAKLLSQEERAPVVEGVREGKLRIEDVREIRKDVKQQVKQETPTITTVSIKGTPAPSPVEQKAEEQTRLTESQVSVPTNTSPSLFLDEQTVVGGHEQPSSEPTVPSPEAVPVAPAPTSPLASAVAISVFEKMLKRDNEALDRIFQRILATYKALTEEEQNVLQRYLQRWKNSIQQLMDKMELAEQPIAEEEVE